MKQILSGCFGLILIGMPVWAQEVSPISAERPGFTSGTDTVPMGKVQFETGYLFTRQDNSKQQTLGDGMQVRVPLSPRSEFRVGLPPYLIVQEGETVRGFADGTVSFKYRFLDGADKQPAFAVIAGTTLPTGKKTFRSDKMQPSVALESDLPISAIFSLTTDFVYTHVNAAPTEENQYAGGLCLNLSLTPQLGSFLEAYRLSGSGNAAYMDGGFTYVLNSETQLDINSGVGLNGIRNDFYMGVGVARRW